MKRLIVIAVALLLGFGSFWAFAQGTTIIPILITNESGADATDISLPFNLSSQTLIDGLFMDADGFDTDVLDGDTSLAYMPGTERSPMLACFDESGADETVDCNDAGADDITLPTTGSAVFEFSADSQYRHQWIDIGQAAAFTTDGWTCEWSYWNGSAYVALDNVTDSSDCFTVAGLQRITFDFPSAALWPQSTLHSVAGYWISVETTLDNPAVPPSTVPLGTRGWYETGRWWALADSIAASEQKIFSVELGTSATTGTETFDIAVSADDSFIQGAGGAYPPAAILEDISSVIEVTKGLELGIYDLNVGFLRFDTSVIPDNASVTSGTLTCDVELLDDDDARSIDWEWYAWSGLGLEKYQTTEQGNANSTDLTSLPGGSPTSHSFTLSNLYNVDKAGFTGLRAIISGGAPTGQNRVQIQGFTQASACTLALVWNLEKQYHWYAPHPNGYTLADNATLEPGDNFQVQLAGYFDTQIGAAGTKNYIAKGTDLIIRTSPSDNGRIQIVANGVAAGTSAVVASGYHTLQLTQGGGGCC